MDFEPLLPVKILPQKTVTGRNQENPQVASGLLRRSHWALNMYQAPRKIETSGLKSLADVQQQHAAQHQVSNNDQKVCPLSYHLADENRTIMIGATRM